MGVRGGGGGGGRGGGWHGIQFHFRCLWTH